MASEVMTLDQFAGEMAKLNGQLRGISFQRPLKEAKQVIVSDTKENFAGSHTPDGTPWPPVQFRIRGETGSAKPLRDTGILMASAISASSPNHVESLTDAQLIIGTNLDYAGTHQYGVPGPTWDGRPKRAKALALPRTIQAKRAGSPRNFPAELDLVWPEGKSFGWLIEHKKGSGKSQRGAKSIIHYMLVSKVRIPARPFLGFSQKSVDTIHDIFLTFIRRIVGGR